MRTEQFVPSCFTGQIKHTEMDSLALGCNARKRRKQTPHSKGMMLPYLDDVFRMRLSPMWWFEWEMAPTGSDV